jgi:ankyrin repeat protein
MGADVEAKDGNGRTPLDRAVPTGKKALGCLLVEEGANVDAKDKDRRTALHKAAGTGHSRVVKQLLGMGANPGVLKRYRRRNGFGRQNLKQQCDDKGCPQGRVGLRSA